MGEGFAERERGYEVQRTFGPHTDAASQAAKGARVAVIADTYFCREIPAGSEATILNLTNAGFRGIEATLRMDFDGEFAIVNLGNVEVLR